MKTRRIAVIGSMNYDIFPRQSRLPQRGETLAAEAVICAAGGKGANQAVQAARLGAEVLFCGAVGKDAMGAYLLQELAGYGISARYIRQCERPTGLAVVQHLKDGSVFATIAAGANEAVTPAAAESMLEAVDPPEAILLQFEIPLDTVEYALRWGKERRIPTLLNAAPARADGQRLLPLCSCLMLNETEASCFCSASITDFESVLLHRQKLRALNPHRIIVTLGAHGSALLENDEAVWIAPSDHVSVVETTGAGDSYAGAYTVAYLAGMSAGEACAFAARAAEITIGSVGAQPAMPTLQQIKERQA